MVRLGVRLAFAGGRETLLRLAVTAIGVGIGVALLLLSLTGQSAVQGRAERSGWQSADSETPATAPDGALFLSVTDYHAGTAMTRAYVASLGPQPPVPPGLVRLPAPDEVAVSPAMGRLLESTPDDQLDDRFPGRVTAVIGDDGLAHPEQLVALIGRTPDELGEVTSESLQVVRGFGALPSGYAYYQGVRVFLLIGAVLLLVPVVVFIVMSTRVGAAHREQRLSAIRLAGATRRQTGVLAGVETAVAAGAGSALGLVAYEAGRRIMAETVTFEGGRFFVDDVTVGAWLLLLVLVGVPGLAALTAVAAMGRAQAGQLGTGRAATRRPPSPWRVLPLVIGVGGPLLAIVLRGVADVDPFDSMAPWFVILTIVGFVTSGPLLCSLVSRAVLGMTRRVPGLLAARRIAHDPRATFRAVSGVVLAAFAVTYSATLVDPSTDRPATGSALRPGVVEVFTGGVPASTVAPLLAERAASTRFDPSGGGELVESCAEFARVIQLTCATSPLPAGVSVRAGLNDSELPILKLYFATDGSEATENRVRSQAANLVPNAIIHTQADRTNTDAVYFANLTQLMHVVWLFILIVAACSLTVGMVAGVIERRRPFALLRASGVRISELRQVVLLETAVAMLVTAAAGVGIGMATSYGFAAYRDLAWEMPDAGVFLMVGVGVLAALVLSTMTLPLLDTSTRHDAVRYE